LNATFAGDGGPPSPRRSGALKLGVAGARADIEAWLQHNRKGAHGEHRYTAEQFGLTTGQIRETFAEYLQRFAA